MNDRPWLAHYDKGVPNTVEIPEAPLFYFLEEAARKYPDRACTIFKGAVISYKEMNALTDHMATAWPCSWARRTAEPTSIPRGGRYQAGETPVMLLIVSVPRSISSTLVASETVAALRWLQLWLPTS